MNENDQDSALTPLPETDAAPPIAAPSRWTALFETLVTCGVPTQLGIAAVLLFVLKMSTHDEDGSLSLRFFATLSLIDTLLIALLIRLFLRSSGERPEAVFIGHRRIWPEAIRGLALVLPVLLAVSTVVLTLRTLFPWMHTVERNPLEDFMESPAEAAVFFVVVVLAGGVREELQRAFILHRFEQRLGGVLLGLVLFTVAFGALHLDQGIDVSVAVGLLGLTWGLIYVRRRSVVLPMANHAGFNAMQVVQALLVKSFGG